MINVKPFLFSDWKSRILYFFVHCPLYAASFCALRRRNYRALALPWLNKRQWRHIMQLLLDIVPPSLF
jgi:hypothetical protein